MKLRLILAAATALATPVFAHAQPVTGPYVSLGAGTSLEVPNHARFKEYGGPGSSEYIQFDDKNQFRPSYAGIGGVGYGFGDGFRVELDGDYIRNTNSSADQTFSYYYGPGDTGSIPEGSFKSTGAEEKYGPMVNVLYDIPLAFPVTPYVGAGAGYQWVKFDRDIDGGSLGGTKGSFAYDIIGGLSYRLPAMPQLSLTAEYRFMQLVQSRNYSSPTFEEFYRTQVGQESSHTFTLGLRYELFPPPILAPAPTPAPAASPAPPAAKTYLVFFDWNKYALTPRADQIIAEAASDSKTSSVTTIDVSGYTDTSGTPTYNQGLSERRAKAVAAKLVVDGVSASEISIHAFGETHLLVPTGPGVREPQNRRVEIVLN